MTEICQAVMKANVNRVGELLRANPNLAMEGEGAQGMTPLKCAVWVSTGSVNQQERYSNLRKVVSLLLSNEADPKPALEHGIKCGFVEGVSLLLAVARDNENTRNNVRQLAALGLHKIVRELGPVTFREQIFEIAEILMQHDPDIIPQEPQRGGRCSILHNILGQYPGMIRDIQRGDPRGQQAERITRIILTHLRTHNTENLKRLLLASDFDAGPPLFTAVWLGLTPLVKLFLEFADELALTDDEKQRLLNGLHKPLESEIDRHTALWTARHSGYEDIARLLVDHGARLSSVEIPQCL